MRCVGPVIPLFRAPIKPNGLFAEAAPDVGHDANQEPSSHRRPRRVLVRRGGSWPRLELIAPPEAELG